MCENDVNGSRDRWAARGTGSALPLDTAFEILSNRHRRWALYYLATAGDACDLDELVDHTWRLDGAPDGGRERIESAFEHNYLPRLEDEGVVEYDSRSRTIRYYGDPLLEDVVDWVAEREACDLDGVDADPDVG